MTDEELADIEARYALVGNMPVMMSEGTTAIVHGIERYLLSLQDIPALLAEVKRLNAVIAGSSTLVDTELDALDIMYLTMKRVSAREKA